MTINGWAARKATWARLDRDSGSVLSYQADIMSRAAALIAKVAASHPGAYEAVRS
jgi:hypothetical protein